MSELLQSLAKIDVNYSVFEKDQVLTHEQLNSIANYLDDQNRLTRIMLLGVGIAYGLRVSINGDTVKVTAGIGVPTDGDLLYFNQDTIFDRFKLYDKSQPKYSLLYREEDMLQVYELVRQGNIDAEAVNFNQFETQVGKSRSSMVAVLLMESYIKDNDICSGTDCDNLGQDCLNTPKLLLVDKADIENLKPTIVSLNEAASKLNEIIPERAIVPRTINTFSELTAIYSTTNNTLVRRIVDELPKLYALCSTFFKDIFPIDPAWKGKLEEINANFIPANGIQYYYDFLKDLAETHNHCLELLFGQTNWNCPDPASFPKHLLLGNLIPNNDPDKNRTPFYPSAITSQPKGQLEHFKFLAKKLDTLIQTFQVPNPNTDSEIRITPSLFEDQPLEERAIPYYYQVDVEKSKAWNYRLTQRKMEARNYSYNANLYSGITNPLALQIGRFPFFRIEGHLGKNVAKTLDDIEKQIESYNLPFTVRAVLLGQDKTKLERKPGIRYTDLHRFHYLLRQDAYHQLSEVSQFSSNFRSEVNNRASSVVERNNDADGIKAIATEKDNILRSKATLAQTKLQGNYSSYTADVSWKNDMSDVLRTAGEFKRNLGDVVKTEFTTPFDSIIGNTHIQWIDWLDRIIKNKDDKEEEKLLFSKFISQHPSLEHFAGVTRGGTFVLVYDGNKTVVADFMLPYYSEDKAEEVPEEPTLTRPTIRPETIIDQGIRVTPSFGKRFLDFKGVIEPEFTQKFDQQLKYLDIYKGFVDTSTSIFTAVGNIKPQKFTDPILDVQIREMAVEREKIELLRQREDLSRQRDRAEQELAASLIAIAEYIGRAGISVASGSEGARAMQSVSEGAVTIRASRTSQTLETLKGELDGVARRFDRQDLREAIALILRSL
ncbi:hypothetical protein [Pseudanabaena sp. PCC 6802]|uniref:hypothetical protein n=1 Tax=Pseudanabaena sp. PCC 6802 TaxID=118173 RepID=UPI0003467D0E|nr:hypothetical protein [Pseudanabaena sp. PCC 6802]